MTSTDNSESEIADFLHHAEEFEARAASERVAFLTRLFPDEVSEDARLLDVGCGNGYAVAEWAGSGLKAIGVDVSLYRLSRWVSVHKEDRRPFVIADATALPFRDGVFDRIVSSGMIEHVGVMESSSPYSVEAVPEQDELRQRVVSELARVAAADATVVVDCPNGTFPVDFWHGNRIGSFRVHAIPDVLLPSFGDLRRWAKACGGRAVLRPLSGRLAFRQVGKRWWGRALAPLMRFYLAVLDGLTSLGMGRLTAPFYPYLVVEVLQDD